MEFMACMGRILDLAFCICTHCLYITLIWEAKIYSQHWVILEQEKSILSKWKCSGLNGGTGGRSKTYQGLRN